MLQPGAYRFVILADLAVKINSCESMQSHKALAGSEKAIAAGRMFVNEDNTFRITERHSDSLQLYGCQDWHLNVIREYLRIAYDMKEHVAPTT
jgi:hypothetical protein